MNVFNPAQFRAQFPALQDAGVYLDSAATALKPEAVVEATQKSPARAPETSIAASLPKPNA